MSLPTLTNGTWAAELPTLCVDCDKAGVEHKCWKRITVDPIESSKLWSAELVSRANEIAETLRRESFYPILLDRVANAHYENAIGLSGINAITSNFAWELRSVSGDTATLVWHTGDEDPANLPVNTYVYNENYGQEGEPLYNTITTRVSLPNLSIMTFDAPSVLQHHGGLIVHQINGPETLVDDATWTVKVFGTIPSNATTQLDGSNDPVYVRFTFYGNGVEPIPDIRDDHPFFAVPAQYTINSPSAQVYELGTAVRHVPPGQYGAWSATETRDGVETAINVAGLIKIEHVGTASWKTSIDLTEYDLTDVSQIVVNGLVESSDNAAKIYCQDRCANSITDYSESWGVTGAGAGKHYCKYRAIASGAATYRYNCFQTTCNLFQSEQAHHPLDQDIIRGIVDDIPWLAEQAAPSLGTYYPWRTGRSSLRSAAGDNYVLPQGYHRLKAWPCLGGWAHGVTMGGSAALAGNYVGLTLLNVPEANLAGTFPGYGPGGNNIEGRLLEDVSNAADDGSDANSNYRQQVLMEDADIPLWTPNQPIGTYGLTQRLIQYELYFPQIEDIEGQQIRDDGTIEIGNWVVGETEYLTRIVMKTGARFDRTGSLDWGGALFQVEIVGAVAANGILTLDLKNGVIGASSGGTRTNPEVSTLWRAGGTNVAPARWQTIRNYASGGSYGPGRHLARRGCAVRILHGDLTDKKFLVTKATPHTGAVQSWKYEPADYGYWTEAQYYTNKIGFHAGLPSNYSLWGNKGDQIEVAINPFLQGWIDAGYVSKLIGKTVEIRTDPVAAESGYTIYESAYGDTADNDITSGALWLGASGIVYLTGDMTGKCVRIVADIYDREQVIAYKNFESIRTTLERLMGG